VCYSVCWRPRRVGSVYWRYCEVVEVPYVIRCVQLCMLEAVEGGIWMLEVPEVIRCVLLCMLEVVEGTLCLWRRRRCRRCWR